MIYENTNNEIAAAEFGTRTGCSFDIQQMEINADLNVVSANNVCLVENYIRNVDSCVPIENSVGNLQTEGQQQQQLQQQYYYCSNDLVQNPHQQEQYNLLPQHAFEQTSMQQQQQVQPTNFEENMFGENSLHNYNINNSNQNVHSTFNQLSAHCLFLNAQNPAQQSQNEVILDLTNASDTSTVDDPSGEGIGIEAPDEAFAYLQGLNSDNLMQFSQQSTLQDLKEQLGQKSQNLDVLPNIEDHDIAGYQFQLEFPQPQKGKLFWTHSQKLNKLYIRMGELLSLHARYTPKRPTQCLRLRALLCFRKEVCEPVLRCQNHISKDLAASDQVRHNMLRCENPNVEYQGSSGGKGLHERYSVVIPLANNVKRLEDGSVKHTIALKFTCQNSCVGRRETSLLFLLETLGGEILSQRVIDVKVCSCPKRDKALEENNHGGGSRKRKTDDDHNSRDSKISKRDRDSSPDIIKKEFESASEFDEYDAGVNGLSGENYNGTPPEQYSLKRSSNGGYSLNLAFITKEDALECLKNALGAAALKCSIKAEPQRRYKEHFQELRRIYDRNRKI